MSRKKGFLMTVFAAAILLLMEVFMLIYRDRL